MKEKVIELLRKAKLSVEKYNEAMALYRRSEGHSVPAASYYNRSGFTEPNLKNLCYDLKKLHNINDADLARPKLQAVKEVKKELPEELVAAFKAASNEEKAALVFARKVFSDETKEQHSDLVVELSGLYHGLYAKHIELFETLDESQKNSSTIDLLIEAIGEFEMPERYAPLQEALTQKQQIAAITLDIPEEAATGLKLREEFPFLNEEDCPDKFKILVADRISAWHKYKEAHAELLKHANGEAMTDAEILALAQTAVEKFVLNDLIWEELKYYKEHKEILGKHELFKDDMLAKEIETMSVKDLMKRQKSLRTYVSRDSKKAEAATDAEAKAKIQAKVDEWKKELDLVDKKLAEK